MQKGFLSHYTVLPTISPYMLPLILIYRMLFEVRGYFRSALLLIPLPLKWIVLKATTKTDKPLSLPFLTIFRFRPLFLIDLQFLWKKWHKGRMLGQNVIQLLSSHYIIYDVLFISNLLKSRYIVDNQYYTKWQHNC